MTDRFESLKNEIDELEQAYGQDWDKQVHKSDLQAVNLSDERCIELARKPELGLADWRELTGISHGIVGRFFVTNEGISFVKWGNKFKWSIPARDDYDAIGLDDKQPPLPFPCTPIELLHFIDTARHDLYGFSVPDDFRQAVIAIEQAADTVPQVPDEAQGPTAGTASSGTRGETKRAEPAERTANRIAQVVALAQKAGEAQWARGERQITARSVATYVQTHLERDASTHGQRGPIGESTIRQYLGASKWRFYPPQGGPSGQS